jgi:hypothetical protein
MASTSKVLSGFTFYGDVLGIAASYRLSPEIAHSKLDRFYNTVFDLFRPLCDQTLPEVHIQLYSDSVVIWGRPVVPMILEKLQELYLNLVDRNLLLRGALVHGALEKEPRVEVRHLRKFLPTNDTLARAVGLEKTVKGARFLIESDLAGRLLAAHPEWLTLEGYIEQPKPTIPVEDVLRRICPSPSGNCYELLYFWTQSPTSTNARAADRLKEVAEFHDTAVAAHLRETLKVLRRSEVRRRRTERDLSNI